jgi:TIR domain
MSCHLFISHLSTETDLAQALKTHLQDDFLGLLDVFVSSDLETIKAGDRWLDRVSTALTDADVAIVLCSRESVARPWVNFEAGAAWVRKIPVIPICHSGFEPNELPTPLNMLEALEASNENDLEKLYMTIAALLGAKTPKADFSSIAASLKKIEEAREQGEKGLKVIEKPRILCAASQQYSEGPQGFELDVAILETTFKGDVHVEPKLSGQILRALLSKQRFDIMHLVLPVHRDSGDLYFSSFNYEVQQPATSEIDRMSPPALSSLVELGQVQLVVLATCDALVTAVEVAQTANMISTDAEITGVDAERWEKCFYEFLGNGIPLFQAFALTKKQVEEVPMRIIRKQDVVFRKVAPRDKR